MTEMWITFDLINVKMTRCPASQTVNLLSQCSDWLNSGEWGRGFVIGKK